MTDRRAPTVDLYYEDHGTGQAVVLAHGLFGSGVNWRGIARGLAGRFRVINADLPNHGRSPHSSSMTYDHMSEALAALPRRIGAAPVSWVGHSMGGKAVMNLALTRPELVDRLVVVDIAPVRYVHDHIEYIDAMMSVDLDAIQTRAAAERDLADAVPDAATRMFLLQNLVLDGGRYRWRLNLPVLRRYLPDILDFPDRSGSVFSGPVLALCGENSPYVDAAGRAALQRYFPSAEFQVVSSAGHWLHADQPRAVTDVLERFLAKGRT